MLLDGVRVLDLSRLLPGGYCTQLLQAQGAQVTKIEPPAGDPIRALPGAFLIAGALVARARSGRGSRVEVSMTELMRSWTLLPRTARRAGLPGLPLTGEIPCYHVYAVADGFLTVAALEPDFWAAFCQAIDREDLKARQFDPAAIEAVQAALRPATPGPWVARLCD